MLAGKVTVNSEVCQYKQSSVSSLHNFVSQSAQNQYVYIHGICFCSISVNSGARNKKIVKKKIDHQKIIDSISDDEHFSAMYLKNLLNDYFKKDKKSFYKNTKKLTSKFKNEKSNFEDWLIFQRYMRYKEFKDLFRIS